MGDLAAALHQTVVAAAQDGANDHGKVSLWAAIVAVGVVVGLLAGVLQIVAQVRRRRFAAAEEKVLSAAASVLDAETAQRDVEQYRALREDLRRQIEDEVPREGRRVYLRARLDDLRDRIGDDVREFEDVSRQLASLEPGGAEPLDHRLRSVVESSVRPRYLRRRRSERVLFAMVVVLLIAAVIPVGPRQLANASVEAIAENADTTAQGLGVALAVWAIVAVGLGAVAAPRLAGTARRARRTLTLWIIAITCGCLAVGTAAYGTVVSVRATEADQIVEQDPDLEYMDYERYEHLETLAARREAVATGLFAGAVFLVFVSATVGFCALRLRGERGAGRQETRSVPT